MEFILIALFALFALIPYVAAHGFVSKVVIDGKEYDGNKPQSSSIDSPIRMISTIDPVKGADNPSMTCGQDAQAAKLTVNANPGSNLQISWVSGDGSVDWDHNVGPIMNYMASCGSNDCSTFNGSSAQFFKIEQSGLNSDGTWVQAELHNGQPFALTLPENLSPGGYLLRNELIALQGAQSAGGAEFYPACIQLLIGGSGSGPTPSPTVQFPGAYSDSDPGILVNVYNGPMNYVFPGGPISNIASPGGNSTDSSSPAASGGASGSAAAGASATPASTSAAAPSASASGSCRLNNQKRMAKRHAREWRITGSH